MSNREDILRELTSKGDVHEVGQRVYYTVNSEKSSPLAEGAQDRVARGFSRLMEVLHVKNVISDDDLDNILLKMVGY